MKIGFIGLGRMGYSMVQRILNSKQTQIKVVAWNRSPEKTKEIAKQGAIPAYSLEQLIESLPDRKIIWTMLPAGKATDDMIKKLIKLLSRNDIIIDGANDFYKNAVKHGKLCKKKRIHFFDCGVSGGVHGLKRGYALMLGGPKSQFKTIEPICKALAPKNGYGYFGDLGSGHYVKSIHNIIEYVYLQGLAEGIELLQKKNIDLKKATQVWKNSVIDSWLLDLTGKAVSRKDFSKIKPEIASVTIHELEKTKKSVKGFSPGFDSAVKIRKDKSKKFFLGKKTIAAVRNEFGGHSVNKK